MQEEPNGTKTEVPATGDKFKKISLKVKADFEAWHGSDNLNVIPNYPTLFDQLGIWVYYNQEMCSI